jgi:hypothetical protein
MWTTGALILAVVGVSERKVEGTNEFGYLWIDMGCIHS